MCTVSIVPVADAVVETPRRQLFERLVLADDDWLRGQFRFHRHRWAGRLELSVQMSRLDAGTVSRTTIDVRPRRIDLQYESRANPVSTQRPAA